MRHFLSTIFLSHFLWVMAASAQTNGDAIQKIKEIKIPGVTIIEIQDISVGNFTQSGKKPITNLPAFIRVVIISKPTSESNIGIELWLPKDTWNGRFLGTGNGGGAGSINYGALASGVIRGFATANTDMGTSLGVLEAVGHPEIWADFGYRATHEMTTVSKAILAVYYKEDAHHSYFVGCSTGGQQALMEAQRYPDDYDGIVAGAPANNRTHLHASFIWNLQAVNPNTGGIPISQKKMELLSRLLFRNCNGKDGGVPGDNFFTDPRICNFAPKILSQCSDDTQPDSCFSGAEIATLKKIYEGPVNPRTGERIYSGLPLVANSLTLASAHLYPFNWVFGSKFDYARFDFDRDMAKVDSVLGPVLNANNPDLEPFKKRGGKIVMYTGTFDQLVPFEDALNYYERVVENQHGLKQTMFFFRYFLVPGMGHCNGGPGLNDFGQGLSLNVIRDREHDLMTAVIDWVESKIPPEKIIATTFNCCDTVNSIKFQRPIFPYPKFPNYQGGDPKSPSSFKGAEHKRGKVAIPDPNTCNKKSEQIEKMKSKLYQLSVFRCIAFVLLFLQTGANSSAYTGNHDNKKVDIQASANDTGKTVKILYPALTEREGLGLNIPKPPDEHPRLFFRERDISTFRDKITSSLLKGCWDEIGRRASMSTEGKLKQDGTMPNLDMNVINAIEAKAFLYAFSNDQLSGEEAVAAIINVNKSIIFDFNNGLVYRDLGRVILATSIVYDWCYNLIPKKHKEYLIGNMEAMASKMEFKWPQLTQGSIVGHGGEAQLSRDMLACGIATYDEKPEIYDRAAGRLFAEVIPARNFFYNASYHNQGSSYGPYRFQWEMYITLLFDRMGFPNIVSKLQGTVPYQWIYTRRPDGQLFRDGDDFTEQNTGFGKYWSFFNGAFPAKYYIDHQHRVEPSVFPIAYTASYYKDTVLMGEAVKQKIIGNDALFDFLLIDPSVKANLDLSPLPLTRYFKEPYGAMVARTGWSEGFSSNTAVALMKIGVYNFANHQHLDAGTFQVYYKGPLAINSGIYQGKTGSYGSDHFVNYYHRSIAHNCMLVYNPNEQFTWHGKEIINDGGQRYPSGGAEPDNLEALLSKDYKTGEVLAHDFGPDSIKPEYTYLKGELAEAYSDKVKSFKRSFVFLNLNNAEIPAALIVFDRIISKSKDFRKTWLLHCVEEPVIAGNITTIKRSEKGYNGQLVNTTLLPVSKNLMVQKVGGVGNEYSVNGKNYPQYFINENNSGDGAIWRIEVSPKNGSVVDNFLNVIQVMDYAGGTKKTISAEKIETDQFVGTGVHDRIVLFNKNGNAINQPFEVRIEKEGIVKVLIVDISRGNWKVECLENNANSPGIINSGKDLLYFNAIKGTYRITRVS